jgi:tight adherence protein B
MILFGALCAAVCAFFAVGLATGNAPQLSFANKTDLRPETSKQQVWLRQAGLDLTPIKYATLIGGFGVIVFLLIAAVTATPVVALAPAAIAVVVPHAFFTRRRTKNMAKTQQVWPDAIREVIANIESNTSLQRALVDLAHKGPEPLRQAFERFPTLSSTLGVVPALEVIRERLADPTSDRVIEVLILAHERGGGIVTDILRDLANSTSDDLQLVEEIESSQLEQKINARAVFVLPWAVLVLLVMSNPQFREFYQSSLGFAVVIIGAIINAVGMFIISRLSRDVPEPRVFGGSAVSRAGKSGKKTSMISTSTPSGGNG